MIKGYPLLLEPAITVSVDSADQEQTAQNMQSDLGSIMSCTPIPLDCNLWHSVCSYRAL